jgi:serine/threonine protein kinase
VSSVYFLVGRILGKYKILEHIGHGGMSEVYKGQQLQLHRPVAIKVLHPFLADDEGFVARFQREALIIATLRHPNIVQVFDFDHNTELDLYYMVMEYIDGPTLKTRMEKENLPLDYIASVCASIADALDYAHERGMIHRDIKPANIMFLEDNQPVLTDFGIAKMLTLSGLTASGAMVGTPAYMAPEVGIGKSGTSSSDIYSLGVVLYQAVTGSLPFNSESPMGIVMQHINDPPPQPSLLVPSIPPALEAVILKAMEKEPSARFARARDMATALRQAMNLENLNGAATLLPVDESPAKPVAAPVRAVPTPPHQGLPEEVVMENARSLTETPRSIALDDIQVPTGHTKPVAKIWWGVLLILALVIAGGSIWYRQTIGTASGPGISPTEIPQHTAGMEVMVTAPTYTPVVSSTLTPAATQLPAVPLLPTSTATPLPETCKPRVLVDNVDIEPDEVVGPGSALMTYISLRNSGKCAWQEGTQLAFTSGTSFQVPENIPLDALLPGETIHLHVPMSAPQAFGAYTAVWQVRQTDGTQLGNDVSITFTVEDLPTATPLPLPTIAVSETIPLPLVLEPSLIAWKSVPDTAFWQGTVHLQAAGGTGNYSFYDSVVREEQLLPDGEISLTAQYCDPLSLDIWVLSGLEVLHWRGTLDYPEPGMCE